MSAIKEKMRGRSKRIRSTTEELAEAVEDFRYYTQKIANDRRLSREVKDERLADVRAELDERVAKIEGRANSTLQRAKDETAAPGLPTNAGRALLVESQKARAWSEVVKPRLDRGHDPVAIADSLAKQGDRLALETLSDRLPSYFELNRPPGQGESPQRERVEAYTTGVNEAMSKVWTEDEREAHAGLAEVDRHHKILQTNLGFVRGEQEGREPVYELWFADSDEPLKLEEF